MNLLHFTGEWLLNYQFSHFLNIHAYCFQLRCSGETLRFSKQLTQGYIYITIYRGRKITLISGILTIHAFFNTSNRVRFKMPNIYILRNIPNLISTSATNSVESSIVLLLWFVTPYLLFLVGPDHMFILFLGARFFELT